jgi:hypothetical protein
VFKNCVKIKERERGHQQCSSAASEEGVHERVCERAQQQLCSVASVACNVVVGPRESISRAGEPRPYRAWAGRRVPIEGGQLRSIDEHGRAAVCGLRSGQARVGGGVV